MLARAAEHLTDVVKLQPVEGVVDDDVVTAGRGNHAHRRRRVVHGQRPSERHLVVALDVAAELS